MLISQICVLSGGILTLVMGVFHTQFYRIFGWRKEFEQIGLTQARIHYTIHMALLLLFFGISCLSIAHYRDLVECDDIGFTFMLILSLFWLWRTIWQVIYFHLPKDQPIQKKRRMHYTLVFIFALLTISYGLPVILSLNPN